MHRACDVQSRCSRCGAEYEVLVPPVAGIPEPRLFRAASVASQHNGCENIGAALALLLGFALLLFLLHPHR